MSPFPLIVVYCSLVLREGWSLMNPTLHDRLYSNHGCCGFKSVMVMPCLEDSVPEHSITFPNFSIASPSSSVCSLRFEVGGIDVSMAEDTQSFILAL